MAAMEEALWMRATPLVATARSFVIPFMMCRHTAPRPRAGPEMGSLTVHGPHAVCGHMFCGSQCSVPGSFEEV